MLDMESAEARLAERQHVRAQTKTIDGRAHALVHDMRTDSYSIEMDTETVAVCDDLQDAVARFNALDAPDIARLDPAYRRLGDMRARPEHEMRVVAVGATPEQAIATFCDMLERDQPLDVQPMHDDDPHSGRWSRVFRLASTGTGMKAAGRFVPGGAVMTWWK